ncbi:MAG TPA: translation elongation factor Ts, partial [Sedimentisphaerales bacterium]|nr:translation elongation factor Ts [Sedimentisphaerales bacterium]
MSEISASVVMKLRQMSGQGMMDCKKALAEANGNLDDAMQILRKKGLATLAKRAGRETSQGRMISCISSDGRRAVLASLCCETDFVANSDDFKSAATALEAYALACQDGSNIQTLAATVVNGKKLCDVITEVVSKTGEKVELGDYARFDIAPNSTVGTYIHFNSKVGAMVEFEADSKAVASSSELKRAALDVAMHITATKPLALDEAGIDPKVVAQEKEVAAEQVKDKPANIIDKIVEGKMKK